MPHYKPKGTELKLAREIKETFHAEVEKISSDHHPFSVGITVDHAVEGVRTNGLEAVTSLYDVRKDLKESLRYKKAGLKEVRKAIKLAERLLDKLKHITTCPSCKGKKGHMNPASGSYGGYWVDCKKCEGRGIFIKS